MDVLPVHKVQGAHCDERKHELVRAMVRVRIAVQTTGYCTVFVRTCWNAELAIDKVSRAMQHVQ